MPEVCLLAVPINRLLTPTDRPCEWVQMNAFDLYIARRYHCPVTILFLPLPSYFFC